MTDATDLLKAIAAGDQISAPTLVLVAHPDDETIGMGGRIDRFDDLLLITATNGAPLDMGDAERAGFANSDAYALARRQEQDRALAALAATPGRICWGVTDQACVDHIADMAERLETALRDHALVVTHPYEGGHPDHDACAMAVQLACARLGAAAPLRFEFAAYHQANGTMVSQSFWPARAAPQVQAALSSQDRARKALAFAAYPSQAHIMRHFSPDLEAYRIAPTYDFSRPPPPGACLYDGFGFTLKGDLWRARAALADNQV